MATTDVRERAVDADFEPLTGRTTAYFGKVFPLVWTAAVGGLTAAVWLDLIEGPAPPVIKWSLLGIWVTVSVVIHRYFGGLKHVWRRGDELIVGDPQRGLHVHLSDVKEIKESRFQQIKTVTIRLRRPTALGRSISFVPKGAGPFFFPLMPSAIAASLRDRHEALMVDQRRLAEQPRVIENG